MSRFTVRVEIAVYPRGKEITSVEESYSTWADADSAFCAYRDLARLETSKIHYVELIEHRDEVVHKTASKELMTSNVVPFGAANANS
jgi:hypothetical protein